MSRKGLCKVVFLQNDRSGNYRIGEQRAARRLAVKVHANTTTAITKKAERSRTLRRDNKDDNKAAIACDYEAK